MAQGTFKWFAQGLHDLGNKIHDLDGDDWRMGIVTGVTPTVATAAPHWGVASRIRWRCTYTQEAETRSRRCHTGTALQ